MSREQASRKLATTQNPPVESRATAIASLQAENDELRRRLAEAEEQVRVLQAGAEGEKLARGRCLSRAAAGRELAEAQREAELEDTKLLQDVSTELIHQQDVDALYRQILGAAVRLMRADRGTIQRFDPETRELRLIATHGIEPTLCRDFARVDVDSGTTCAMALRTRARAVVPDFTQGVHRDSAAGKAHRAAGVHAAQSTPLITRSGELLGMMSTHWAEPHEPEERSLRMLDVLARHATDLIERRQAEEALRESEARLEAELADTKLLQMLSAELVHEEKIESLYRKIVDAAVAIMRSDYASMQMYYPERGRGGELRLLAAHGFSRRAEEFWEWVRADSGCTCGEALRTGRRAIAADVETCEFMAGTPDRAMYLEAGLLGAQSTPLISRGGKLLGMLSTHWKTPHAPSDRDLRMLDILARQAADLIERRQGEEALRASEQRFRVLFESMDEGYCVIEVLFDEADRPVDYRFLEVNPAFEKQTGIKDAKGRRMREIAPDHEEHWFDIYGKIALTGETVRFENPAAALGRYYDVCAFRVGPAELRRVGIVFNDITARKKADAALRQSKEALTEADRRKDEFLATLAHELRNPLAPIRNSLHVLRLAGGDGGACERVHEMMERQVNHMVRLVDDLMEVSRITRGKIDLRKERVELAAVVRSAVETSRPLIEAARHQLAITLPAEPLTLDADPVRLAQVLANLLNNAAKYTEEGGQISLTVRREGPHAVVSVRDTGMGIPTEMLPKVFDLFTQVDRTLGRSQGGLGIGLTLVRSLVELHGGGVEARSDGPGHGSEFVVRLPLAHAAVAPTRQLRNGKLPAIVPRRILVVDDNRDAAESLGMLLELLGAEVRTANDGAAALDAIQSFRPAVVLLDLGMPGMDGYEVAKRTRQLPEGAEVTLIALTGWGQDEDRRRSKGVGIECHLVKPVDIDDLEAILSSLPPAPPTSSDLQGTPAEADLFGTAASSVSAPTANGN